ncbi:putative snare ykt6 [Diaporthe ampelina]|uniref:Synaptobrevin homolog YKT6 n=1 Tax=Diaporthe ampelina TaxID=1214573 RepID=A0A0G2FGH1_9PEZI|nr:putative snare ykt6 [Diaporthe ampelina]
MKLHYIGVIRNEGTPSHELVSEKELSAYSRFTRNNYGEEFMTVFAKTVAERTKPGLLRTGSLDTSVYGCPKSKWKPISRESTIVVRGHYNTSRADRVPTSRHFTFHAYGRSEGVCGIIISDHAYPGLVAHQLLSKIVDEFLEANPRTSWVTGQPKIVMPQLKEYIDKYQDPHQADNILKIQKELDETKIVLHKTIESVLQRGEKIDDLVQKSDGLSSQSKMFYQQAKKQNSCCQRANATQSDDHGLPPNAKLTDAIAITALYATDHMT